MSLPDAVAAPCDTGPLQPRAVPRHLGIILDGNRRWARDRGLPTAAEGHRTGFGKIPEVLTWCADAGTAVVTLWMLSDDNITHRTTDELRDLYTIDEDVITQLVTDGRWQLHHIGQAHRLPAPLASLLRRAEQATRNNSGMLVNLAIGYGGRNDILSAVRTLVHDIRNGADPDVTEQRLASYLSTAGQPDPDLVIRPSGELRTSGFLLWQAALAELYFCDALWPDFSRADLAAALESYAARQRRFGA